MPPAGTLQYFGGLVVRPAGARWWEWVVAGNSLATWALAGALFVGSVIVLRVGVRVTARRAAALAQRTATRLDDLAISLLNDTRAFFFWAIGLALASLPLTLSPEVIRFGRFIVVATVAVQTVFWGRSIVQFGIDWFLRRRARERGQEDSDLTTSMVAVRFISLLVLYSVVFLVAADNLGFDVTALVAGLGIGGVAVALAVQNILGDLFSSLSIVLDKPFVVGDLIIVGDKTGTVEHVGLKTTRLRALSGEQLVMSNSDLLTSRIHNYKRMRERRAVFMFGITYATPADLVERVPALVQASVDAQDKARLEYCAFKQFGVSSLDFETVYWIDSSDYTLYMKTQERINVDVLRRLTRAGIRFASTNAPEVPRPIPEPKPPRTLPQPRPFMTDATSNARPHSEQTPPAEPPSR